MKSKIVFAAAAIMLFAAGCQSVTRVEYYEPTPTNAAYCTPTSEGTQGHGPLKSVEGKSGTPDWSDHKSFSLKFNFFGL